MEQDDIALIIGHVERQHLGLVLADLPGPEVHNDEDEPANDVITLVVRGLFRERLLRAKSEPKSIIRMCVEYRPSGKGCTLTTRSIRISSFSKSSTEIVLLV